MKADHQSESDSKPIKHMSADLNQIRIPNQLNICLPPQRIHPSEFNSLAPDHNDSLYGTVFP